MQSATWPSAPTTRTRARTRTRAEPAPARAVRPDSRSARPVRPDSSAALASRHARMSRRGHEPTRTPAARRGSRSQDGNPHRIYNYMHMYIYNYTYVYIVIYMSGRHGHRGAARLAHGCTGPVEGRSGRPPPDTGESATKNKFLRNTTKETRPEIRRGRSLLFPPRGYESASLSGSMKILPSCSCYVASHGLQ